MELMSVCFIHEANIYQAVAVHMALGFAHRECATDGIQDHTVMGKGSWKGFSAPSATYKFPIPPPSKYSRL